MKEAKWSTFLPPGQPHTIDVGLQLILRKVYFLQLFGDGRQVIREPLVSFGRVIPLPSFGFLAQPLKKVYSSV